MKSQLRYGSLIALLLLRVASAGEAPPTGQPMLANPGELEPREASWSPDGRQVAFARQDGGIGVVDLESRHVTSLASKGKDPAWSPDGKFVAHVTAEGENYQSEEVWMICLPIEPVLTNQLPARVVTRSPANAAPVAAWVGQYVPVNFKLPLLEGGELVVRDARATNSFLLGFWASWCGPCRQIMPLLAEVAREYAGRGLRYVAVNLREEPDVIRRYLATAGIAPTVALDAEGRIADAFQVRAIPTMVLIDPKGAVAWVHEGSTPDLKPRLTEAVRGLLDQDQCVANLKVLGLASRIWAVDHGNVIPRDLHSMSNEVSSTQVLVCPADTGRRAAADWGSLTTNNVSYEFLAPSVPVPDLPGRRQRVVFRCPTHDNVACLDGAVRARPAPGAPDQLLRENGILYLGPPGVPADGVDVPEQLGPSK